MVCLWIKATFLSFFFFYPSFFCTKSSSITYVLERNITFCKSTNYSSCIGKGGSRPQQQGPPPPPPVQTPKSSPEVLASPPPPPPVQTPKSSPEIFASPPPPPPPPFQTPKSSPEVFASPPAVQTPKSNSKGIPPPPAQSPNDYNPSAGKESRASKRPRQIVIEVAVSVVGVTILCIAITCLLKRKHPPNPEQRKLDVQKFILHHGSLAPTRYKYSEIKKMTKSFSVKLGQGGYGSVYKGVLPNGRHVAVKVLIETDSNSSGEEFTNEVASISRTSHVNIVTLLGFCHDRNKRAIVYEFMPNKSLDKFLKDSCLDLKRLFRIAVGIAKGLEYLHTGCATRIVHFDIKPQNILLDDDLCPKISDFGLARLCKRQQSILSCLGMRGTIGYIAPEVFSRNFGGVSHKSDVYSYGMMLLEMAGARQITHESIQSSSCENYFPDGIYEQVVADGVNRKVEEYSMIQEGEEEARRKMYVVGFWCIQSVPLQRPSISKVVEMLEGSLQSLQIPPKPFLFHPNLPTHEISSPNVDTEY